MTEIKLSEKTQKRDEKKKIEAEKKKKKVENRLIKLMNEAKEISGRFWWQPKAYWTKEELQIWIIEYFNSITKDTPRTHQEEIWEIVDDNWKLKKIWGEVPTLNNNWEQIIDTEWLQQPSILWMALHLNITSKTLKNYEKYEDYFPIIKKARDIIEQYVANQLNRREQVTGIIFNLKNTFWRTDKTEIDNKISWELKGGWVNVIIPSNWRENIEPKKIEN